MKLKTLLCWVWVFVVLSAGALAHARTLDAYYSKIDSGQAFERYSRTGPYGDVVVALDHGKFVFWRGSSYLPYWQTKQGKWYVSELYERQGDGPTERPDKVNTFSRVIIAENTSARVVVHWRYPLVDVHHVIANFDDDTGWGDWYYTIYPDCAPGQVVVQSGPAQRTRRCDRCQV